MVSAVIPAFNEAATIAEAASVAVAHADILEVIVVDDGSTDGTARAAERAGATVVRLDHNQGKALAMEAGVKAASHDIILFLDADVTGLTSESLDRIMQPVVDGRHEMYVGLRARKTLWLNRIMRISPIIGGERALTRRLWHAVPGKYKKRFQIEIALNYTAKHFEQGMGFELVTGTVHRVKEQKYGLARGLFGRLRMIADILAISIRLYILDAIRRYAKGLFKKLRLLARTG
jgi:polyprenyl-phospho-N-acetylgalactosaminyl synthase